MEENSMKIFDCDDCGKRSKQSSGLSRHKRVQHPNQEGIESQQLFDCPDCKKRFNRKDNRDQHAKHCAEHMLKSIVPPCSFPNCGKKFPSKYRLERHIKQVHESDKENTAPGQNRKGKSSSKKPTKVSVKGLTSKNTKKSSCKTLQGEIDFAEEMGRLFAGVVESEFVDTNEFHGLDIESSFSSADITQVIDIDTDFGIIETMPNVERPGVQQVPQAVQRVLEQSSNIWNNTIDEITKESPFECCSTPVKSVHIDDSLTFSPTPNLDLLADVAMTSQRFTPSFENSDVKPKLLDNNSNSMSPNTRQRKCRIVKKLMETVHSEGIDSMVVDDRVDILSCVLNKLGLNEKFLISQKPTKAGRKMTSMETRQRVWEFWHNNSTQSTLTSRPAKLPVRDKPKIQTSLTFKDCTVEKSKRGISSLVTTWQTTEKPYRELLTLYNLANPLNTVSYGTFFALKPFYVRGVTTDDMEISCCKKHLHARWSVKALLDCAKLQNINLPFTSYASFFDFLNENCQNSATTYLNWTCTPDANVFCQDIKDKWDNLKEDIIQKEDKEISVTLQKFVRETTEKISKKTGKEIIKLVPKYLWNT